MERHITPTARTQLSRLVKHIQYIVPDPYLMVLGGSRVVENHGRDADAASDYDIVALSSKPDLKPYSLNNFHGCADVIVRNPATLAYEVGLARDTKRGAVLRTLAYGTPLYNPYRLHEKYKGAFQVIYRLGPLATPRDTLVKNAYFLQDQQYLLSQYDSRPQRKLIAANWLAHDMGKHRLDLNGQWQASGKMLGRFLHTLDPAYHARLLQMMKGQATCITGLFPNHVTTERCITPLDRDYQEQNRTGHARSRDVDSFSYACRERPTVLMYGLTSVKPPYAETAQANFRYHWTDIHEALNAQRLERPSGEVAFTLAKATKDIMLQKHRYTAPTIEGILRATIQSVSPLVHLDTAHNGDLSPFKTALAAMMAPYGGLHPAKRVFKRTSPPHHTLTSFQDPATLPDMLLKKLAWR